MPNNPHKTCIVYCRVSVAKSAQEGESLDTQDSVMRRFVADRSWEIRYQCNKILRHTVHLWAQCCTRVCPWAEIYYRQKRAEGKSHACALRCVGQRLLKILWKMVQTRKPYDADLHARNQKQHGSWVLALMKPVAKTTQ